MAEKKLKILFISHEASRTGAPLLLLHLVKWLKSNAQLEPHFLFRQTGVLYNEFEQIGKCYKYEHPYHSDNNNIFRKIIYYFFIKNFLVLFYYKSLKNRIQKQNYDLIYSNTIANGTILEFLSGIKCKVITHIHELQFVIDAFGEDNMKKVIKNTDYYITSSDAVKINFVNNYKIDISKIFRINYYIVNYNEKATEKIDLRKTYPIKDEKFFLIGTAGTIEWRKGSDLFIQLANLIKSYIPVYFLWIGGFLNDNEKKKFLFDLKKTGLENKVFFTGNITKPNDYYNLIDLFVLLSREEPFGIVGIECAYLEKPVLCFADAGGMPEFVENDSGIIIPYLNLNQMAEKAVYLLENEEIRKELGCYAKKKVDSQYTIEKNGKLVLEIIRNIVEKKDDKYLTN